MVHHTQKDAEGHIAADGAQRFNNLEGHHGAGVLQHLGQGGHSFRRFVQPQGFDGPDAYPFVGVLQGVHNMGHDVRGTDLAQQIHYGQPHVLVFIVQPGQQLRHKGRGFRSQILEGLHSHLPDPGGGILQSGQNLGQIFPHAVAAQSVDGHHALHGVVVARTFFKALVEGGAVQIDAGFQGHFLYIHIAMVQLIEDHVLHFRAGVLIAEKDQGTFEHFGVHGGHEKRRVRAVTGLGDFRHGGAFEFLAAAPEDLFELFYRLMVMDEAAGVHGHQNAVFVFTAQGVAQGVVVANGGQRRNGGLCPG